MDIYVHTYICICTHVYEIHLLLDLKKSISLNILLGGGGEGWVANNGFLLQKHKPHMAPEGPSCHSPPATIGGPPWTVCTSVTLPHALLSSAFVPSSTPVSPLCLTLRFLVFPLPLFSLLPPLPPQPCFVQLSCLLVLIACIFKVTPYRGIVPKKHSSFPKKNFDITVVLISICLCVTHHIPTHGLVPDKKWAKSVLSVL